MELPGEDDILCAARLYGCAAVIHVMVRAAQDMSTPIEPGRRATLVATLMQAEHDVRHAERGEETCGAE